MLLYSKGLFYSSEDGKKLVLLSEPIPINHLTACFIQETV